MYISVHRPLTSNRHHLSYDDCLENKGRLQDYSCSILSYHCIQCYAHILWAAPTGQTDLSLSHWVYFTVLRCICVFVFCCISLHACCIIVTRWGGPGGIEAWSDDWHILLQCFDTVGWVTWPVKISSPNDLYCVEWDVKPYSTQLVMQYSWWLTDVHVGRKYTVHHKFCGGSVTLNVAISFASSVDRSYFSPFYNSPYANTRHEDSQDNSRLMIIHFWISWKLIRDSIFLFSNCMVLTSISF